MMARIIFHDQNEVFGDASRLLLQLMSQAAFEVGPIVEGYLISDRAERNWYQIRPIFWDSSLKQGAGTLAGVMLQYAPPPN